VIARKHCMTSVELLYIPCSGVPLQVTLDYAPGMVVSDALNQSDVFAHHPEARDYPVGIFSKKVSRETPLKPGDRVEIYRPLLSDPKEKRRQRASRKNAPNQ
jgi:putative ubiquitin-RnfH superfamily antitoxin RatB of RatAB toxin-antitoxin module